MRFRLVPKSVTLNDVEQRNGRVVCVISPNLVAIGARDDLRKILPGCCQVTNVLHYRQMTDDRRQTDGRTTTYSEREHEFTFAKKPNTYALLILCLTQH